jgi:hypothetical protein
MTIYEKFLVTRKFLYLHITKNPNPMKNLYSSLKKLTPIVTLAIVLSMLASCSSSNQFASSFSKRKYMTGHYSDPIAKVKAEVGNAINVAATDNKKAMDNNAVTLKKEDGKITEPSAADQKSASSKTAQPCRASKHSLHKNLANKIAAATSDKKNANSIEQNTSISTSPDSLEKTTSDSGGHHHYLLAFFLCLLLGLLFTVLAAASVVAGSAAGLGLFAILAYVMWIAALVFLILWIVSLVS